MPFQYFIVIGKRHQNFIYDNTCQLHAYCLKREGNFFKDTLFGIDALHITNHCGCGRCYDIKYFYKTHGDYRRINSVVCEQKNAMHNRIKLQSAYANPDWFMLSNRLLLELDNLRLLQRNERNVES